MSDDEWVYHVQKQRVIVLVAAVVEAAKGYEGPHCRIDVGGYGVGGMAYEVLCDLEGAKAGSTVYGGFEDGTEPHVIDWVNVERGDCMLHAQRGREPTAAELRALETGEDACEHRTAFRSVRPK